LARNGKPNTQYNYMKCDICHLETIYGHHDNILSGIDHNKSEKAKIEFLISWINYYSEDENKNSNSVRCIMTTTEHHHSKVYNTLIKLLILQ
jgi:hypothetical protein